MVQEITSDRLLSRLDDAVRSLVRSEDITFTAARVLGQHLHVDRCAYASVDNDEDTFHLIDNYTNGVPSIVGRYRFRQFGEECLRLMRSGQPYVVEDAETDARIRFDDRPAYLLTSIRAVVCVPILKSERFVAAMAVHMHTPRVWAASEIELVQRVASRSWESIERTRVEWEREALLERAESANRTKYEFLAMLGHQLRNPLAPISTALQLMKLQNDAAFERERTVIERQVRHLTRLVDDLLDVSRIARAKVVLEPEPIDLFEIVQRAVEVVSPLLEERAHARSIARRAASGWASASCAAWSSAMAGRSPRTAAGPIAAASSSCACRAPAMNARQRCRSRRAGARERAAGSSLEICQLP
jgi:GAF domain-containing protein